MILQTSNRIKGRHLSFRAKYFTPLKSDSTRLIVGLGNPGKQYLSTRHNIGFRVVDQLAAQYDATFHAHPHIPALITDWKAKGSRWIALKPITFMNLSGQAVVAALNFWKIDLKHLLVIVDDVEISPGGLRLRLSGSAGGHNGLKSLIEHLGTKEFSRLRVGIGRPLGLKSPDLANWVLQPFEKSELLWAEQSVIKAVRAVESWVLENPVTAMNQYNQASP